MGGGEFISKDDFELDSIFGDDFDPSMVLDENFDPAAILKDRLKDKIKDEIKLWSNGRSSKDLASDLEEKFIKNLEEKSE